MPFSHSPANVHLGCGERRLPGFINVDSRESFCTDLVCDMNCLPFEDSSIDLFYLCHSLEHIPMHNIQDLLRSLNRMLRPNGQIYISVPDFSILSSLYLSGRVPLSHIVRAIHGGQEYDGNTHFMSFDLAILSAFLTAAGFSNVVQYSPEVFLPYSFRDTSTYEIGGKRISLNVCAQKK
jgi:predicted SAM-dependent methyltransferase